MSHSHPETEDVDIIRAESSAVVLLDSREIRSKLPDLTYESLGFFTKQSRRAHPNFRYS